MLSYSHIIKAISSQPSLTQPSKFLIWAIGLSPKLLEDESLDSAYIDICMYMCINKHTSCVCMCVYIYIYAYVDVCIYIYICIYIYMYMCDIIIIITLIIINTINQCIYFSLSLSIYIYIHTHTSISACPQSSLRTNRSTRATPLPPCDCPFMNISLLFLLTRRIQVLEPVARWLLRRRRHSPRHFEVSDAWPGMSFHEHINTNNIRQHKLITT